MKISARNIVISALLTWAVGLFMTVFAQNAGAQSVINVSGTTWVGTDSDGDYYEYSFQADGALYYKSPSGFWTNGTWKQNGSSIYMETNKKYSEYQGQISGTHMEGNAWNIKDKHWTWVADLRNTPPTFTNGGVPSVSGTIWSGADSLDYHYDYEFRPDGTLRYTYENGSFTDGTWKQDGDTIYMSMNNKYSERLGRITGTHMGGTAWNIKDKHWTWAADLRNTSSPPANSSVPSLAGTSWNATETDGDIDIFYYLPDGTLSYSYQAGSFTNGTWRQDGDAVYMQMNNKYVEYHGRITGTHMEGTAHNVTGKDWTWKADKRP
jgi:hypothetical protein